MVSSSAQWFQLLRNHWDFFQSDQCIKTIPVFSLTHFLKDTIESSRRGVCTLPPYSHFCIEVFGASSETTKPLDHREGQMVIQTNLSRVLFDRVRMPGPGGSVTWPTADRSV